MTPSTRGSLKPAAFAHRDLGRMADVSVAYVSGTEWTPDNGTWTTVAWAADGTTWVEVTEAPGAQRRVLEVRYCVTREFLVIK